MDHTFSQVSGGYAGGGGGVPASAFWNAQSSGNHVHQAETQARRRPENIGPAFSVPDEFAT